MERGAEGAERDRVVAGGAEALQAGTQFNSFVEISTDLSTELL